MRVIARVNEEDENCEPQSGSLQLGRNELLVTTVASEAYGIT